MNRGQRQERGVISSASGRAPLARSQLHRAPAQATAGGRAAAAALAPLAALPTQRRRRAGAGRSLGGRLAAAQHRVRADVVIDGRLVIGGHVPRLLVCAAGLGGVSGERQRSGVCVRKGWWGGGPRAGPVCPRRTYHPVQLLAAEACGQCRGLPCTHVALGATAPCCVLAALVAPRACERTASLRCATTKRTRRL